jgi:hypothetical protein
LNLEAREGCVRGFFKRLEGTNVEYPFVEARIYLNDRLLGRVEFLVDTGGGATLLSYRDLMVLGLTDRARRETGEVLCRCRWC